MKPETIRQRLLEWIYQLTRRRGWWILVIASLAALLSLYYVRGLKLDSDFKDLLPPGDKLIQKFNERQAALQGADVLTVLLSLTQTPSSRAEGVDRLRTTAERLIAALQAQPEVTSASYRPALPNPQSLSFNLQALSEQNLSDLQQSLEALSKAPAGSSPAEPPANQGQRLDQIYAQLNQGLEQAIKTGGLTVIAPKKLQQVIKQLSQSLVDLAKLNKQVGLQLGHLPGELARGEARITPLLRLTGQFQAGLQQLEPPSSPDLLLSRDRRSLLVNVHFRRPSTDSEAYNTKVTRTVRQVLRRLALEKQGFQVGLTGSYVFNAESQAALLRDTDKTTLIAIVGISLLFILILGRLFYPILASLPIFMSLLISLALVRLTVGSLNLLTTFLPPLMLGMGIDYGIQFITHFLEERQAGHKLTVALHNTLLQKGSAMLIASLATSSVLFGLLLASSPGLQQMGLLLGLGILLANLLTLFVLPALIMATQVVFGRRGPGRRPPRYLLNVRPLVHLILRVRWPLIILVLGSSLYVGLTSASQVGFEFVSDKLIPKNLPTVETRARINRAFERSSFDAQNAFVFFVKDDPSQIQQISRRLLALPAIDQVINYYSVMPLPSQVEEIKGKLAKVRSLDLASALAPVRAQFKWLRDNLAHRSELRRQWERLQANLGDARDQAAINGQEGLAAKLAQQQSQVLDLIARLDALNGRALTEQATRLSDQLDRLAQEAQAILRSIPTPQDVEGRLHNPQLQRQLQRYFFTAKGAMIIYAHVQPAWIYDSNLYKQFIGQLNSIWPDYLGAPMLQARLRDYMESDFQRSTLLAIALIMLIIWLDFRRVKLRGAMLLALAPLILGYIWMLAAMHWLGIQFNFVNILISPLLLGLGVDNCVYLLHRHQDLGQRDVEGATSSTAVPILANALAAMIGLGSLALAEMSALQVLGQVALLGIGFTTLFSLTFLPAVLSLLAKRN